MFYEPGQKAHTSEIGIFLAISRSDMIVLLTTLRWVFCLVVSVLKDTMGDLQRALILVIKPSGIIGLITTIKWSLVENI